MDSFDKFLSAILFGLVFILAAVSVCEIRSQLKQTNESLEVITKNTTSIDQRLARHEIETIWMKE